MPKDITGTWDKNVSCKTKAMRQISRIALKRIAFSYKTRFLFLLGRYYILLLVSLLLGDLFLPLTLSRTELHTRKRS